MSNRRTRSPRGRKGRSTGPSQDVGTQTTPPAEALGDAATAAPRATSAPDPTQTGQLRALEAGWDELL